MAGLASGWDAYWQDEEEHAWWERPAPEVLDLIRGLSPETHPAVLDLGCGLGRHAIAFARAGFRVTATDASAEAVAHVARWAAEEGLAIATRRCEMRDQGFPPVSFDVVIAYNVLYHGYRADLAAAIAHVRALLRPGGLFFLTCPTREDGKYGYGECVAPHTYTNERSVTGDDMHYFADRADLDDLLAGFRVLSCDVDEAYWEHRGARQFASYWRVLAESPLDADLSRAGGMDRVCGSS